MSNDLQRIDRILNLLAIYWKRNPSITLGACLDRANLRSDSKYYLQSDDITEEQFRELLRGVE